jgi:hypothetical protein
LEPNRIPATPVPIMPRTTRRPTGLPSTITGYGDFALFRPRPLDLKLT